MVEFAFEISEAMGIFRRKQQYLRRNPASGMKNGERFIHFLGISLIVVKFTKFSYT